MATVFHCKYLKATLFRISQKYHAQEKQKKLISPFNSTPSVKHQNKLRRLLTKLNEEFHCLYGKKFTDVVCKVPEAKLQAKPTEAERKKRDRKIRRDVRDELQNVLYSRDSQVLFGTRQTASQYESQRKAMFMESPADAKARTEKRKLDEESGKCKKERSSKNLDQLDFDKAGLLNHVNSLPKGSKVCLCRCQDHISI
ncbi:uncharacterized protein [Clytia hemisphaerica]|uniref:uncharacterized protein n=1 Tax=Clytia hemisphaerica TaxID=252671 RepID=UPI0034D701E8